VILTLSFLKKGESNNCVKRLGWKIIIDCHSERIKVFLELCLKKPETQKTKTPPKPTKNKPQKEN